MPLIAKSNDTNCINILFGKLKNDKKYAQQNCRNLQIATYSNQQ